MRSAGCVVNDMLDSRFDAQVERTKDRPLASGELSKKQAASSGLLMLSGAAACLLPLNQPTQLLAVACVGPTAVYPLMKRFTWYPQLFLGLVFNWGAVMGCAAVTGSVSPAAWMMYAGCVSWTVAYDTIYATPDRKYDAALGLKSSALAFGEQGIKRAVPALALGAAALWELSAYSAFGSAGAACMLPSSAYLMYSTLRVDYDDPSSAARYFNRSGYVLGPLVMGSIIASKWIEQVGDAWPIALSFT